MKAIRAWLVRFAGLFLSGIRERDLNEELEAHLQLHIDDNLRAGMSIEEARRQALLKLGGVEATKEACRDRKTIPFLEHLMQDVRFAVRQFRKYPGFTCTGVVMLALGICASVAIFAFVEAALIRPLPYRDPARLVEATGSVPMIPRANLSYLDYRDFKRLNTVFTSLEIHSWGEATLDTDTGSELAAGARVSDGFFRLLGVKPLLGRDFYPGEDAPGAPNNVILSYASWQKRFGGAKDVIGKTVKLNGVTTSVVGVLPKDFHFAPRGAAEFWTTFHLENDCQKRRSCHNLYGVARLKDGVSLQTAQAEMKSIALRLAEQYPDSNRGQTILVTPLAEIIRGDIRPVLLVLLGGAAVLLLIAAVNVTSLLLVRSESRRREIAVRNALGASRTRLLRQFTTEGLLLAAVASVTGIFCARWLMQLLIKLIPTDMLDYMPYLSTIGLNPRVLLFALMLSLIAGVLFSVMPGAHLHFASVRIGLVEGARGSAGNTWRRIGSKLVVVELALAVVLLVGAGLLGKSLNRLLTVRLGLEPEHLATLNITAPPLRYSKENQQIALAREIVNRGSNLPGVQSVAITSVLPVSFNGNTRWIRVVGKPYNGEHNEVNARGVSSGYFTTIRARLLKGRIFTDSEDTSKPSVVIINSTLAKRYFPGQNPIGATIGDTQLTPRSLKQIIGVVDDIKDGALDAEIWPAIYFPFNQEPDSSFSVLVRTAQSEQALLKALPAVVRAIDPAIVASGERTMLQHIRNSQSAYLHRSSASLIGGFAFLALLLAIIGLYGVIAYSVTQRTREIGVRMALGAQRRTVYRLVLGEAGWLALAGLAIGLLCSVATTGLLRKLLFGVQSWDVPTLVIVAIVLGSAAILASYLPARRAASVNPVEALRTE